MGKKLIINGADFSANGIEVHYATKIINVLVNHYGVPVDTTTVQASNLNCAIYVDPDHVDKAKYVSGGVAKRGVTNASPSTSIFKTYSVEDYTDAIITSVGNGIVIGFLAEDGNTLLGGYSTDIAAQEEGCPLTYIESIDTPRTLTMQIPSGAKYVCASAYYTSPFEIVLRKEVE